MVHILHNQRISIRLIYWNVKSIFVRWTESSKSIRWVTFWYWSPFVGGPVICKKIFFLILYSNTCVEKTKCMVHMSLKLSVEIVKFMTFWLFFFFKKVERVICCTWSCLFRYIYICYCPSKSEKHHVYANKQLIWTWKNIKDKAFYTCIR